MKILAVVALLFSSALVFPQSHGHDTTTRSYSAAFRGSLDVIVVREEHAVLRVNGWSKWSLRDGSPVITFRITATPFVKAEWTGDRPAISNRYIKDMGGCHLYAKLYDKDSFPLAEIPFNMTDIIDSDGNKTSLEGTATKRMSESDYLEFVRGGSWTLGWSCPGQ